MPAITVTETTVIDQPVDKVFRYISDCANDVHWCPAVREVWQINGTPGAIGATYLMRHSPGGMKFKAKIQVMEANPPRRFGWLMTDGHSRIRGTYTLASEGAATRLTQTSEVDFRHVWKVMGLLMRSYIKKDIQKNLREQFDELRRVLEKRELGELEPASQPVRK